MKSCEICGSYAINEGLYERERGIDSNLCDPHYWQKRAKDLQAQLEATKRRARYMADLPELPSTQPFKQRGSNNDD